jgi:uncharacterized protein DUF4231
MYKVGFDMVTKSQRRKLVKVDEEELEEAINELPLGDFQKDFLRKRWLHQVLYWDKRANESERKYYALRSATAVLSVIIPALVSLNLVNEPTLAGLGVKQWFAILLGMIVASSVALEEIFHFGDIWREKRNAVELLMIEGWRFFQLSGDQYKGKEYKEAYAVFASQVEGIIQKEIER